MEEKAYLNPHKESRNRLSGLADLGSGSNNDEGVRKGLFLT